MSALTPRWITLNRPGERNQEIENIYTLSRFTPLSGSRIFPTDNAADHGIAVSLIFIRDRTAWRPDRFVTAVLSRSVTDRHHGVPLSSFRLVTGRPYRGTVAK